MTKKYGDQIIAGTLLQLRAEDGLKYVGVYHGDDEIALTDYSDLDALMDSGYDLATLVDESTELERRPLDDYSIEAPIARPSKVACIGLNFKDHILEMGHEIPTFPTLFAKFCDSLTSPFGKITLPSISSSTDYEGELVIVIGKLARNVSLEDAPSVIGGFCVGNDTSMRDFQRRTSQFLQGKIFDASTPFGPGIVPSSKVDYQSGLGIQTIVNGELRQSSNTENHIFSVDQIVSYLSQIVTLRPGDLIFTGTSSGVGAGFNPPNFLKSGDVVQVSIEGLGSVVNEFV
ncbi:MAG: fumarylacetoacetate hydrolase family protein [Actinomycetota bacterium]|nr:fumarylacetoacetate hydrolase family protein [Actinomycetota bacterium]